MAMRFPRRRKYEQATVSNRVIHCRHHFLGRHHWQRVFYAYSKTSGRPSVIQYAPVRASVNADQDGKEFANEVSEINKT
jgi:hypothetical protein